MLHKPQRGSAASSQLHNPFIVASPSPSPTHAAVTTTIHMDSADDLNDDTSAESVASVNAPAPSHVPTRTSLSTYQLASAALRRLPARPAPTAQTPFSSSPSTTSASITPPAAATAATALKSQTASLHEKLPANVNATEEGESDAGETQGAALVVGDEPFVDPSAAARVALYSDRFRPLAPPPPLQSASPKTAKVSETPAATSPPTGNRLGGSPGRFRVPPLQQQQVFASPALSAASTPFTHKQAEQPQQQQQQQQQEVESAVYSHQHVVSSSLSTSPPVQPVNEAADRHRFDRSVRQLSKDYEEGGFEEEEEGQAEENEEDDEEDVALRVLSSLQQKDDRIHQLTAAIAALKEENAELRSRPTRDPLLKGQGEKFSEGTQAGDQILLSPPQTTKTKQTPQRVSHGEGGELARTPDAQRAAQRSPATAERTAHSLMHSPSLPRTPVRWWKEEISSGAAAAEAPTAGSTSSSPVKELPLRSPPPSLAAAHAAVDVVAALQAALKEKEAELAALKSQRMSAPAKPASAAAAEQEPFLEHHVSNITHDDDGAASAEEGGGFSDLQEDNNNENHNRADHSVSTRAAADEALTAALATAQARVAQLEYQLDTVHDEKREEQRTTREHIDYLTRELHNATRAVRRQERQHKTELAELQREVVALADQLEAQLRAATAANASTSSAAQQQHELLEQQLKAATRREEKLKEEHATAQQQWQRELAAQQDLLKRAQEDAARLQTRKEDEAQLLKQLTEQQHDVEVQVQQWKIAVGQARKDLAELRAVHQRTEETVAVQRAELRELTEALAVATLQHTHDTQQATQQEGTIELLREQLRTAEAALAVKESEMAQLKQDRAAEVDRLLNAQDDAQQHLLCQVEGCVKGSEAVESALLAAEAQRREVAAELTAAVAERDALHKRLRTQAVETQAHVLEQQQLFQEGQAALQQQLREAQERLCDSNGALEATQAEVRALTNELKELRADHEEALDVRAQLSGQVQSLERAMAQQTTHLVETKEALKEALQAQLATTNKLTRAEQQVRFVRTSLQRAEERRVEIQRAVQRIGNLLWPSDAKSQPQQLSSAITSQLLHRETFSSRAHRNPAHASAKSKDTQQKNRTHRTSPQRLSSASVSSTPSSRSSSQSSSTESATAESVVMSAVNTVEADPSTFTAEKPLNISTLTEAMKNATPVQHSTIHHREIKDDSSVLQRLTAIHDTVQQLLTAHAAATQELQTKRSAVRTLVQERKAQHETLAKAQTALETQQQDAARQKRDYTKAFRAETKTALEELKCELETRHREELATCRTAAAQQHEADQRAQVALCVTRVRAQLMDFVQQLPAALHASLTALSMDADVEQTQQEIEHQLRREEEEQQQRQQHHLHWASSQGYAAEAAAPGYGGYVSRVGHPTFCSPYAQPHVAPAPTNPLDQTSYNSPNDAEVAPEVEQECDVIAREVLGLAGGWSDLSNAAAMPSSSSYASPQSYGYYTDNARQYHESSAYLDTEPIQAQVASTTRSTAKAATAEDKEVETSGIMVRRTAHFTLQKPIVWPAAELKELQEVIGTYLTQFFAAAGPVSDTLTDDAQVQGDKPSKSSPAASTPPVDVPSAGHTTTEEGAEAASLAMGLARWMKSLRQPKTDGQTQTPPDDGRKATTTKALCDTTLGKDKKDGEPLALLLSACVVHVMEHVLRGGVAHVTD